MSAIIRLASVADAPAILEIYGPITRDTHISFEQVVPDASDIAGRIRDASPRYPWLVCQVAGQVAGYAYASAFRSRAAYQWTVETTVYVHAGFLRRGIARALYRSLLAILRQQGYCQAIGVIALPNPASIRAHESLGFRHLGTFRKAGYKAGAWRDTGWWQLELGQPLDPPLPPLPLTGIEAERLARLLRTGLPSIHS